MIGHRLSARLDVGPRRGQRFLLLAGQVDIGDSSKSYLPHCSVDRPGAQQLLGAHTAWILPCGGLRLAVL